MEKNQVALIGHGYVGQGMNKIFPEALIYDPKYLNKNINTTSGDIIFFKNDAPANVADLQTINQECGLAIICVPTPPKGMDGVQAVNEDEEIFREVDLSFVESAIKAIPDVPFILIKSTVPPGTTDSLNKKYGNRICFSPEYLGEGKYYTPPQYPDPEDARKHDFVIIGGDGEVADEILVYFQEKLGPAKTYFKCKAVEAECIKYMENTWGATKVIFANEWYEICQRFGASYNTVREGWVLDSRVERMHTAVFPRKRGFGGKCFPKDLLGIIAQSEKAGYEPSLLKQVWNSNKVMLKKNGGNKSKN